MTLDLTDEELLLLRVSVEQYAHDLDLRMHDRRRAAGNEGPALRDALVALQTKIATAWAPEGVEPSRHG